MAVLFLKCDSLLKRQFAGIEPVAKLFFDGFWPSTGTGERGPGRKIGVHGVFFRFFSKKEEKICKDPKKKQELAR